jgi:hypothetical protein
MGYTRLLGSHVAIRRHDAENFARRVVDRRLSEGGGSRALITSLAVATQQREQRNNFMRNNSIGIY